MNEFLTKAKTFGLPVFAAGDAEEIAEASAAMFTGKIRGLEMAKALGRDVGEVPPEWHRTAEVLKSRPGATTAQDIPDEMAGVFPVFHCVQEIPCNPCTSVCPKEAIHIAGEELMGRPVYDSDEECIACEQCVAVCPGLAITLVDFRKHQDAATVSIPYEFTKASLNPGEVVTVLDLEGKVLGNVPVLQVRQPKFANQACLVKVKAPFDIAKRIAGIRIQEGWVTEALPDGEQAVRDDEIVCRCERVTAGELRALIRGGARDMNHLKAATRCGMGACGGKTCPSLIARIFREEGVAPSDVTALTQRPVFMEVPLGVFAGAPGEAGAAWEAPPVHAVAAVEGGV